MPAKHKRFEDWFVETAALIVTRLICAAAGFGITLLIGVRLFLPSVRHASHETAVEAYDSAFYMWLLLAAMAAAVFAVVGPKLLHALWDSIQNG